MKPRKLVWRWAVVGVVAASTIGTCAWAAVKRAVHAQKRTVRFEILHNFTGGRDGSYPYGRLIVDRQGNLYGTTSHGGRHAVGTVFELSQNGGGDWRRKVLHAFGSHSGDGAYGYDQLIFDQRGNLYSTTGGGGAHGGGSVFELLPDGRGGWKERVIHSFGDAYGEQLPGGLIFDKSGNLYGRSPSGSGGGCTYGCGSVWELSPNGNGGWKFATLQKFDSSNGANPWGDLNIDASGELWGTTSNGGTYGYGVVFELTPNGSGGWIYNVIHNFNSTDGAYPAYGRLVFGKKGHVFGTTEIGGTNDTGTVFTLIPGAGGSYNFTSIYSFGPELNGDGNFPCGGLRFDKAGHLYGTTTLGGSENSGTVFELVHGGDGWTETVLHSFADGSDPYIGVTTDEKGHFYGTTTGGGSDQVGTVFEITP